MLTLDLLIKVIKMEQDLLNNGYQMRDSPSGSHTTNRVDNYNPETEVKYAKKPVEETEQKYNSKATIQKPF